jgi:major membrane immunogen (membrane-anchored lipoprotein)
MNNISVEDATNSYIAARDAAFNANALTVEARYKAYGRKLDRDDAEAKFILASNESAKANAAYNAAAGLEQSADKLVVEAKANLAKVVSEAVHT